jgi:hypothetical protein
MKPQLITKKFTLTQPNFWDKNTHGQSVTCKKKPIIFLFGRRQQKLSRFMKSVLNWEENPLVKQLRNFYRFGKK